MLTAIHVIDVAGQIELSGRRSVYANVAGEHTRDWKRGSERTSQFDLQRPHLDPELTRSHTAAIRESHLAHRDDTTRSRASTVGERHVAVEHQRMLPSAGNRA